MQQMRIYAGTTASTYARLRFQLQPWQAEVVPEHCTVPPREVDRLRRFLIDVPEGGLREDQIKYVGRQHVGVLLYQVVPTALVAVLAGITALVAVGFRDSGHYANGLPWYYVPLLGLVLCVIAGSVAFVLSWQWRYTYVMITNLSLILRREPPASLFLLRSSDKSLGLDTIQSIHLDRSGLEKLIKGGSIGVQSSDQKQPFDHLPFLSHPEVIEEILRRAYLTAQHRPQPVRVVPDS